MTAGARRCRALADGLTVARALIGLPLLLALLAGQGGLAWILLLLGGLSDWADGALARRAGGGSAWGARLDPLTDKILISAPLLWLGASGGLPLWAVWLLLARELLVSGWRAGQGGWRPRVARGQGQDGAAIQRPAAAALAHWLGPHWRRPGRGPSGPGLVAVLALASAGAEFGAGLPQASKAASALKSGVPAARKA